MVIKDTCLSNGGEHYGKLRKSLLPMKKHSQKIKVHTEESLLNCQRCTCI